LDAVAAVLRPVSGGLAIFRGRLLRAVQPNPQVPIPDALVGEIAIADEDVPAGSVGRVELRGTTWSARNETGVSLTAGHAVA
jgi:membrane protein implicated in regulation of membrane protease activity